MKALVLAGGFPQIDLLCKLKERHIETVLVDYYENPIAKEYADKSYRISTLDVKGVRNLAREERVDFIITVCTDQALLTVAQISEELNLPCYISYEMARNVTNKSYMKELFLKNGINSAKYMVSNVIEKDMVYQWRYPLVVKPVDCNSSKGVCRVENYLDLERAFYNASQLSRTKEVIIEEFISGKEISVDAYVENGEVYILDITTSEKIDITDRFIIFRTIHPARITEKNKNKIYAISQKIADSFGIRNAPLLIQLLVDGENVYVIEFSARTGGGVKHLSIYRRTGVDMISAVIDLTLGYKPNIVIKKPITEYMVDEYIYCDIGVFDHVEGFEELKKKGIVSDYYVFKSKGSAIDSIECSGDRVGGFTIEGNTYDEIKIKHSQVNQSTRIVSQDGKDIMRHDLLMDFNDIEF